MATQQTVLSLAALIAGAAIALALTLLVEALRTPHIRHQCQLRKAYRHRALPRLLARILPSGDTQDLPRWRLWPVHIARYA
jgi:hypothetical protein